MKEKVRVIVEVEGESITVYSNDKTIDIDVIDHNLWHGEDPDTEMVDFYELLEEEADKLHEVY